MTPLEFNLNFSQLALLGFYIIALIYVVYSTILIYHWREYSVEDRVTSITLLSYFIFTLPLMTLLFFVSLSI